MFEQPVPGYELLQRLMMQHQQAQQGGYGMMQPGQPMMQPMMGPGGMPMMQPPNGQPGMMPIMQPASGQAGMMMPSQPMMGGGMPMMPGMMQPPGISPLYTALSSGGMPLQGR